MQLDLILLRDLADGNLDRLRNREFTGPEKISFLGSLSIRAASGGKLLSFNNLVGVFKYEVDEERNCFRSYKNMLGSLRICTLAITQLICNCSR
ncbi:MAG: hypothetical protein WBX01_13985 [Nitrososphaeraceae archaeon]